MDGIDKLTMELLMNKAQYTKYLSTQDPARYEEIKEHNSKVEQYKDTIIDITTEYCENPNKQVTNELDDAFRDYVKTCIKYLEMKSMENNTDTFFSDDVAEDAVNDDVMFKTITKSFWGKGAIKKQM